MMYLRWFLEILILSFVSLAVLMQCEKQKFNASMGVLYEGTGKVISPATDINRRNTEADIIELNNGTLLLAYSKFEGYSDFDNGYIAGKISFDGGDNWTDHFMLQKNIGLMNTVSPSFIHLGSSKVGLFFTVKDSKRDLQVYMKKSSDMGESWTDPKQITKEPGYHVLNNDRVLKLDSGRIIVPVSYTTDIDTAYNKQKIFIYYSDDNGSTWKKNTDPVSFENGPAMEPGIAELQDGSLLMNIRTKFGKIYFSRSYDGGHNWSEPYESGLDSPESPATIERIPGSNNLMIVWNDNSSENISNLTARSPLSIGLSDDRGKTWTKVLNIEQDAGSIFSYPSITLVEKEILLTYYHMANESKNYYNLILNRVYKDTLLNEFQNDL